MIQRLRLNAFRKREAISESHSQPLCALGGEAGFSLMELLTVIAIIAILAAIIFPVAGVVRVKAQEASVRANLESIHTALGLYKQDEHTYPATLGPLVIGTGSTFTTYNGLFPEFLKDQNAYQSPANDVPGGNNIYSINWSLSFVGSSGSAPSGINDPVLNNSGSSKVGFYSWNDMDGRPVPNTTNPNSGGTYILHYTRYRTFSQNDPDYKRQLGFRNPPDDTVVTWNDSFVHRNSSGQPISGEYLVLFLSGTVKQFNVKQVEAQLQNYGFPNQEPIWRIQP